MSVGNQITKQTLDNQLTAMAVNIRNVMDQIRMVEVPVISGGLAFLEAVGYSSAPNAANPGGVSDAQYAQNLWSYLQTLQQIYYGLVQQGGTGGTGASVFNFDNALASVWGGQ